jgi:hypothetical protein
MAALAYSDFDALPDTLAVDRFEILLNPTTGNNVNQTLAVRCVQLAIPAEITEPMIVAIQGLQFQFRGRRVYDQTMVAAFVETVDGAVQTAIRTWTQQIVGSESGNGATKSTYAIQGTVNVFDQSGNTALGFLVDNMWPTDVGAMQMDGAQAQPYIQTVTFAFDRLEPPTGIAMS